MSRIQLVHIWHSGQPAIFRWLGFLCEVFCFCFLLRFCCVGSEYHGVQFSSRICGVSMMRSGMFCVSAWTWLHSTKFYGTDWCSVLRVDQFHAPRGICGPILVFQALLIRILVPRVWERANLMGVTEFCLPILFFSNSISQVLYNELFWSTLE